MPDGPSLRFHVALFGDTMHLFNMIGFKYDMVGVSLSRRLAKKTAEQYCVRNHGPFLTIKRLLVLRTLNS